MGWRSAAACLHTDSDLFFPVGSTGPAVEQIRLAKQVCADCPVQSACLDWAIEIGVDHGVWGGLSEDERRSQKRRRARHRAAQPATGQVVQSLGAP